MRKYLTKRNIIVAVVIVVLLGWWGYRSKSKTKSENDQMRIVEVKRGDVVDAITVSGEIKAENQAVLNFPVAGKLAYIGVTEGDTVKKWQTLASLDLGDLQAAETKAYYTYLAYDAAAKKVEDDLKGKGASENFLEKSTRVTAQTNRDMAYDAWLTAQRAVRNAKLTAPFAGVVTNVTATVTGDTVSITDGVTVVDPTGLYFSAEVDESDVGKINMGQRVQVELDAFENQKFEAEVDEIGFVSALSSTGATVFPVKIKFEDAAVVEKLRLGMNGDARIILTKVENVLYLPLEAIVDGRVIKVNGEQKPVEVKTGLEGESDVEIKTGLSEGDKVVIK